MGKFSNVLFLLLMVHFSCSNSGTVYNDSAIVSMDKEYSSLRQNFKDSLEKGLKNVNDFYKLYSAAQKATLDSAITRFEKRTRLKITVITFDSTMTSSDSVEVATRIIGIKSKINTTVGISPDFKKMVGGLGIEAGDDPVDDVAGRAELAVFALRAHALEEVFEGVAQLLAVGIGEAVYLGEEEREDAAVAEF